jgi:hypothetical protein
VFVFAGIITALLGFRALFRRDYAAGTISEFVSSFHIIFYVSAYEGFAAATSPSGLRVCEHLF